MSKVNTLKVLVWATYVLFLTGIGVNAVSAEEDLVGRWKFDEGSGTVVSDSSGNNNHGTIHGAAWASGTVGSALNFDGSNDYVEIPKSASLDNLNKITLMAWVKTPLTGRHSIFARWLYGGGLNERCLELDISSTKIVNFALSAGGGDGRWLTSNGTITANKWMHIAATSDGVKMKIYINGVQDPVTIDAPATIHASSGNLHIGAWWTEGIWSTHFKGLIDEAKIYSRALTAEEILQIYQQESPRGRVKGMVKDTAGVPIEGAKIDVGLFSDTTGATGEYTVSDVPAGIYEVTASKAGYVRSVKENIEVKEDEDTIVNFTLTADSTAPVISNVQATYVASVSTVIVWTTNELADSRVKFGTTSGNYPDSAADISYTTSHSVALTGLSPKTTYYYVVESGDLAQNPAQSAEQTFTTDELGDVIIWDTNEIYTMKGPTRHAVANKANWTQVPYGMTSEYTFKGDPMIQNKYCQLFLFTNKEDSVDLAARLEGGGYASNEIYKVNDIGMRCFGMGTVYTKILKNTPNEMSVEHAGLTTRTGTPKNVVTDYTLLANRPWLRVDPKEFVNQQGMHGKTRICAFVKNDGGEFIFDSKREPWTGERNIPAPAGSIGIINFRRGYASNYDFMWFLTFCPGAESNPLTYLGFHWDPFWGEEVSPDRPSVGAQYVYMNQKVAIAALRYKYCWTRENVEQPIAASGTYTTAFAAPYPGKWRLIGRVGDQYYSSTVNITKADVQDNKKFTFTSPVAGTLDYLLMYLRDRNSHTPSDVYTVMDVYREAIQGKTVVPSGRHVFYNNSAFDGDNAAANADDDGAVAPDKTALLPGGTATFANYTSYSRGINGIMVDIANLPGTPTAADFTFKVGNDSTPASWADAPASTSITVREGAGVDGSDRITIVWADNAIQKQWLQVTVKATTATGLASDDVFYFGNAIGETGNSATDATVKPTDEVNTRNNPHSASQNPADIDDAYDFNRDKKVGPTDEILSRNNGTNSSTALQLITAP